jgi:RNA polymerase sigma-70 factor (ECF subfamily)
MSLSLSRQAAAARSDGELVTAIARGDLESLGLLFDRYESPVRSYLGRLGIPGGDVDDLVQLTFLEVQHAAPRFDVNLSARSWLYGIATMMVRRHRRSLGRAMARLVTWAAQPAGPSPITPDEAFESSESVRKLTVALDGMSSKKREVFVLVALEGLSGEEVAKTLSIPVNTVWTRLHHARKELMEALEP